MKHWLLVFEQAPHESVSVREGLDLAMLAASFEQQVTVLFEGAGVNCLRPDQQADEILLPNYARGFGALADFGIERMVANADDFKTYQLDSSKTICPVELLSANELNELYRESDCVVPF